MEPTAVSPEVLTFKPKSDVTSNVSISVKNESQSLLGKLAQDLGKQVQILGDYLHSAGLAQPSFDRNTPVNVMAKEAPEKARRARN